MSLITPKASKKLDADTALEQATEVVLERFARDNAVDPELWLKISIAASLREIARKK